MNRIVTISAIFQKCRDHKLPGILIAFLIIIALLLVALHNFLLFHVLAELFSIIVAASIFVVAWEGRNFKRSSYLLTIGIAYGCVGFFDLIHTLAYKGMGIIATDGANLPTQLWITARYLESISLVAAFFVMKKKISPRRLLAGYAVLSGVLLASIFLVPVFPVMFIKGQGLTLTKITSEYIISGLLLVAVWLLYRTRNSFSHSTARYLYAALLTAVISEMSFTLYSNVYALMNIVGHLSKIVSFYFLYKAMVTTAIKEPYTDLQEANDKVNLVNRNISRVNEELRTANDQLESFTYALSHDLRTPLRSIYSFSQILLQEHSPGLGREGADHLERIIQATENLRSLVDGVKQVSQITRESIDNRSINLSRIAHRIVRNLQERHPDRRVTVSIQTDIYACCDEELITIALENLLGNAWKFTTPRDNAFISFESENTLQGQVYTIKDNGVGFDNQFADKLFTLFQRLHQPREFEGRGVGLAIVKQIIQKHEGSIWADSIIGQGATFCFTLHNVPQKTEDIPVPVLQTKC